MRVNRFVVYGMALGVTLAAAFAGSAFSFGLEARAKEERLSDLERLGRHIFEDTNLSEPAGLSCASCHEPAKAFQGHNNSRIPAVAQGSRPGHFGSRNTPSLMYAAFIPAFHFTSEKDGNGDTEWKAVGGQFLDGRATHLAEQVEGPLLNADEMNNASRGMVVDKVRAAPYAPLMRQIFGTNVFDSPETAFAKIAEAVAAFENTAAFRPFSSKFDAVLAGRETFTPQEAKGFTLFKDPEKGNCIACHVGKEDSREPTDWLFTDLTYDNLGVPRNTALPTNGDPKHFDLGLCKNPNLAASLPKEVTADSLCGAFRVPTLRNIAVTAPYMHNGFFTDLRETVRFYATRDTAPGLWYPKKPGGGVKRFDDLPKAWHANVNATEAPYDRKRGESPRLTDEDIDALVAFLNTLTDAAYAKR